MHLVDGTGSESHGGDTFPELDEEALERSESGRALLAMVRKFGKGKGKGKGTSQKCGICGKEGHSSSACWQAQEDEVRKLWKRRPFFIHLQGRARAD